MLLDIIRAAKECFCDGIYIPVKDQHPCGWDFISFHYIDVNDSDDEQLGYLFTLEDISGGIYDCHDYEDCTLDEILDKTKCKYAFEIESINW